MTNDRFKNHSPHFHQVINPNFWWRALKSLAPMLILSLSTHGSDIESLENLEKTALTLSYKGDYRGCIEKLCERLRLDSQSEKTESIQIQLIDFLFVYFYQPDFYPLNDIDIPIIIEARQTALNNKSQLANFSQKTVETLLNLSPPDIP